MYKKGQRLREQKIIFMQTKFVTDLVVVSLPVAVTLVVGHRDSLQPLHVPHLQRKYLPPFGHFIQGRFSSFYLLMNDSPRPLRAPQRGWGTRGRAAAARRSSRRPGGRRAAGRSLGCKNTS